MKGLSLVDQIIFTPLNALVKDGYIFSLGALIYDILNNDIKLKKGDVEFTQLKRVRRFSFLEKS